MASHPKPTTSGTLRILKFRLLLSGAMIILVTCMAGCCTVEETVPPLPHVVSTILEHTRGEYLSRKLNAEDEEAAEALRRGLRRAKNNMGGGSPDDPLILTLEGLSKMVDYDIHGLGDGDPALLDQACQLFDRAIAIYELWTPAYLARANAELLLHSYHHRTDAALRVRVSLRDAELSIDALPKPLGLAPRKCRLFGLQKGNWREREKRSMGLAHRLSITEGWSMIDDPPTFGSTNDAHETQADRLLTRFEASTAYLNASVAMMGSSPTDVQRRQAIKYLQLAYRMDDGLHSARLREILLHWELKEFRIASDLLEEYVSGPSCRQLNDAMAQPLSIAQAELVGLKRGQRRLYRDPEWVCKMALINEEHHEFNGDSEAGMLAREYRCRLELFSDLGWAGKVTCERNSVAP